MGVIATGRHDVTITATALVEKNGEVQINVSMLQEETNDTITAYLHTTEKSWPHTEKKLRACGWDAVENGYRFEELNAEPSPLVGNRVNITVDAETWEGQTRNKVGFINPIGGVERMEPAEAQSFAAQLRARITGQTNAAPMKAAKSKAVANANEKPPF